MFPVTYKTIILVINSLKEWRLVIPHRPFALDTHLQATSVSILNTTITLCSVHLPPTQPVNMSELKKIIFPLFTEALHLDRRLKCS